MPLKSYEGPAAPAAPKPVTYPRLMKNPTTEVVYLVSRLADGMMPATTLLAPKIEGPQLHSVGDFLPHIDVRQLQDFGGRVVCLQNDD